MSSWDARFYHDVIRDREWITFGEPLDVEGSPQTIKALKNSEEDAEDNETICRIDLTPLIEEEWITRSACTPKVNHFYHSESLEKWTKQSHSQKCPTCTLPRHEMRFDRRKIVIMDQGQPKTIDNDQWKVIEKAPNRPKIISMGYCNTALYRELREPYLSFMNNYVARSFIALPINLVHWVSFAVSWVALKIFSSMSINTWCHVASVSLSIGTGIYLIWKGVQLGVWWAVVFGFNSSAQTVLAFGGGLFGTCLGIVATMVLCDHLELGDRLARFFPNEIATDPLLDALCPEFTPYQVLRGEVVRREIPLF